MPYIAPTDRFQTRFTTLEDGIDKHNPVRVIDAFVDKLELSLCGFIGVKNLLEKLKTWQPKYPKPTKTPKSTKTDSNRLVSRLNAEPNFYNYNIAA